MDQRAINILNRWLGETLRPVPEAEIAKEAARLATEFAAYAADAGLHLAKLEEELGEDLAGYMEDALAEAAAEASAAREEG